VEAIALASNINEHSFYQEKGCPNRSTHTWSVFLDPCNACIRDRTNVCERLAQLLLNRDPRNCISSPISVLAMSRFERHPMAHGGVSISTMVGWLFLLGRVRCGASQSLPPIPSPSDQIRSRISPSSPQASVPHPRFLCAHGADVGACRSWIARRHLAALAANRESAKTWRRKSTFDRP